MRDLIQSLVNTLAGLGLIGWGLALLWQKTAGWRSSWKITRPKRLVSTIQSTDEPLDVPDMTFVASMGARYRDAGRPDIAAKCDELLGLFLTSEKAKP